MRPIKLKAEYSTPHYDYVTTGYGRNSTPRTGIGKGILVNVSSVVDGVADIWTVNAWGRVYTDTISVDALQDRNEDAAV